MTHNFTVHKKGRYIIRKYNTLGPYTLTWADTLTTVKLTQFIIAIGLHLT